MCKYWTLLSFSGVKSARGLAQSKILACFEVGNWLPLCSHGFVRWLAVVFCWRLVGLVLVLLARSAVCADLPLNGYLGAPEEDLKPLRAAYGDRFPAPTEKATALPADSGLIGRAWIRYAP
jgi:hypothetical protein